MTTSMLERLRQALGDRNADIRGRIVAILGFLIAANLGAWGWALVAFRDYPVLLGTALLAYSFGARHAVDADHIAAIDNVTRKFMQQGRRPVAVGFYFSLGHSTVVVLASAAIAAAAAALEARFAAVKAVGTLVGTSVSALFLFAIALAEGSRGLPIWSILVFPALFTAGMSLVDTADGILMLGAYGWAFMKPLRKLYYNLTITFVSVLAVGAIGSAVIGFFAASWAVSFVVYRLKRYDEIEAGSS